MKLTSPAFRHGEEIPRKYTCQGQDISPPLEIHDVPADAKSFVLVMDDPDVPKYIRHDGMWDHWVLFNIDPEIKKIGEGENPGTLGKNSSGKNRYQGPCPPDRRHRYFFKLYALDAKLDLPEGSTKAQVEKAMKGRAIAQAELMGVYEKK